MKLVLKIIMLLLITSQKNYFQTIHEQLQNKLESFQQSYSVYGLTAALMIGDEIIWSGTAGYSNPQTKDKITIDMTSSIGSITKIFTSAIILQLAEEGKLTLNQTKDNWFEPSEKINESATIRQLLNHTSGIYFYTLRTSNGFSETNKSTLIK